MAFRLLIVLFASAKAANDSDVYSAVVLLTLLYVRITGIPNRARQNGAMNLGLGLPEIASTNPANCFMLTQVPESMYRSPDSPISEALIVFIGRRR